MSDTCLFGICPSTSHMPRFMDKKIYYLHFLWLLLKLQWTCQIVIYSRLSLNIERFCFLDYFNVVQSKSCLDYLVLCKLNLVLSCISLVSSFFSPFLGFIQAVLLMSVFWVLYSHIVRKDTKLIIYKAGGLEAL